MSCDCLKDDIKEYIKGDTFKRQVTVVNTEGETVDLSLILKVEFLLLDMNANIEKTSELDYDDTIEKWIVEEDTSQWKIGTHMIRYKITYVDDTVLTPYEKMILIRK